MCSKRLRKIGDDDKRKGYVRISRFVYQSLLYPETTTNTEKLMTRYYYP